MFSAICATLFFIPRTWAVRSQDQFSNIESVVILSHYDLLIVVSLLAAALLMVLAILSLQLKTVPFRAALWILPLILYPVSLTRATLANLGPWQILESAQDSYGNNYYFLEQSFLQGQLLSIARHKTHSFFKDEYEVLAVTNGDYPRHYLNIVRPANAQNLYGQVYVSKDKWVVGVRFDNQMYLAYNLTSKSIYVGPRLYTLSPFLLIDDETLMNQVDVEQVLTLGIGSGLGQTRLKPILAEFRNTNPDVASLAHTMAQNIATVQSDE